MRADFVFLTGATGFVGGHVLRELVGSGYRVRALVRGGQTLAGCETIAGDLEQPGTFARALDGCRYLVHCAALYSFAPADRARMRRVNVVGTESLLAAAHLAGVERAVVTSRTATVGPAHGERPATETDYAPQDPAHASSYHASKIDAERIALAARVPAVLLLPSAPVGPGDHKPTPTGKMFLDFARGRMTVLPPPGGLNLVAVEDVAKAHVAALELGRTGERYIIAGKNMSLDAIWSLLSEITGIKFPQHRIHPAVAFAAAYADELRCRLNPKATPFAPLEGLRMAYETMYVDGTKAESELNIHPSPIPHALERAVQWFRTNGYLESKRVA